MNMKEEREIIVKKKRLQTTAEPVPVLAVQHT